MIRWQLPPRLYDADVKAEQMPRMTKGSRRPPAPRRPAPDSTERCRVVFEGAALAGKALVQRLRDADVVVQGYDYVAGLDRYRPDAAMVGIRLGVVAAGPLERIEQVARRIMSEFPASTVTVHPHEHHG